MKTTMANTLQLELFRVFRIYLIRERGTGTVKSPVPVVRVMVTVRASEEYFLDNLMGPRDTVLRNMLNGLFDGSFWTNFTAEAVANGGTIPSEGRLLGFFDAKLVK